MSLIAFFGALESGLIYALVALGVLMSFQVLDFPDLTADGSFPLGGAARQWRLWQVSTLGWRVALVWVLGRWQGW